MDITISFKHLEHTPALDDRIREKSKRFEKYLNGRTKCKWTCYVKGQEHFAEVELIGPTFDYHAKGKSDNLYKSFDLAVEKIEKQLCKKKEKWKNHLHNHRSKNERVFLEPGMAWLDHEDLEVPTDEEELNKAS